jgi:hypothetical protein
VPPPAPDDVRRGAAPDAAPGDPFENDFQARAACQSLRAILASQRE